MDLKIIDKFKINEIEFFGCKYRRVKHVDYKKFFYNRNVFGLFKSNGKFALHKSDFGIFRYLRRFMDSKIKWERRAYKRMYFIRRRRFKRQYFRIRNYIKKNILADTTKNFGRLQSFFIYDYVNEKTVNYNKFIFDFFEILNIKIRLISNYLKLRNNKRNKK